MMAFSEDMKVRARIALERRFGQAVDVIFSDGAAAMGMAVPGCYLKCRDVETGSFVLVTQRGKRLKVCKEFDGAE